MILIVIRKLFVYLQKRKTKTIEFQAIKGLILKTLKSGVENILII
jgi:hypothetical protein